MSEEKTTLWDGIKFTFMRGIVVIVPIVITIVVLNMLFNVIDGIISPLIDTLLGYHITGLGFISLILLILIVGLMSKNLFGTFIIKIFDRTFLSLPLARTIYSAIRDLISAFAIGSKSKNFKNVVLVEYPRKGIYSIGFATNELDVKKDEESEAVISVYFPHPPNPTSGVLVFVPRNDVQILNITIEEGLKLVLSGGVVSADVLQIK